MAEKTQIKKDFESMMSNMLQALANSTNNEMVRKYNQEIQTTILKYEKFLKDPSSFDSLINHELSEILEVCVLNLYPELEGNSFYRMSFLYQHYQFIELHLENFIEQAEGSPCSTDKAKWIIENYRAFIISEEIPTFKVEKKDWWKPKFGTGEQWMNLCDSLQGLYYGKPIKYLGAIQALMEALEKNKVAEQENEG
ncbi:hypothetical protein [Bacillus paranthracis]|uniref:hypothetical protein n=1 Tax=Bacillus paranthracis TaxID=2026186 RepID=UPI002FDC70A2|nr:hypothetical protein [Bacillus paranthracis]